MPSKLEARVFEHDRQIAAIKKLILTGMKMINENNIQIKALTKSQRETDRLLKDLLRSLGRQDKANGHGKPPNGLR
jgi:hypothetical protein